MEEEMHENDRNGLQVVWGMRMAGRNQDEREWIETRGGRVGAEWDVRKWKSEIDREVKCVGLNECMEDGWSNFLCPTFPHEFYTFEQVSTSKSKHSIFVSYPPFAYGASFIVSQGNCF